MRGDELEATWVSLAVPPSRMSISGRRAHGVPANRAAYLAIDGQSHRHLLVEVPDDTEEVTYRRTRGLHVSTGRYQIGTNPEAKFIDLTCPDVSQHSTFTAVAQDLLQTLTTSGLPARDAVIDALSRWRAFWTGQSGRLSWEEVLGLFGELWFLRGWLGSPLTTALIERWHVTANARHDFQWPDTSVEVKTTAQRADASPVHRISSLDQLEDPSNGQLYLFSLHVTEDPLSANTLPALVEAITEEVRTDASAITLLNCKLAEYGYSPDDAALYRRPLRVLGERLYAVTDGFPRLTTSLLDDLLPEGVGNITYNLSLAACAPWQVAASPADEGAAVLRAAL